MKTAMDAGKFADIADNVFAPVYPVLARMILKETGVRRGLCVDIGAGTGKLGGALAEEAPELNVVLYDSSEEMLRIAGDHYGGEARISLLSGRAEEIPLEDNSADLVVSRGSMFFWDAQARAFSEILRILKPDGRACIGCGFGNARLLGEVTEKMKLRDPEWNTKRQERLARYNGNHFRKILDETGIADYRISDNEAGLWIRFGK